ncbi:MAG: hypothetical protein WBA74_20690 [Cyclobacteriaceae bacterium]
MKKLITFWCLLILLTGCVENSVVNIKTKNSALYSFAKLYGDVKFFCPSDESAQVDWDAFAYYGVTEVLRTYKTEKIEDILDRLFSPIVPGLQIGESIDTTGKYSIAFPDSLKIVDTVSWQHFGHGDRTFSNYYKSVRLNRTGIHELK